MKSVLIAATLLASTALAIPAANALQIGVGGDLGVTVTIGGDDDTGINLGVGAGATVDAGAAAGAGAGAGAGAATTAVTNVQLRTDAAVDATTDFAVDALVNATVWTEDNVQIGVVTAVTADADGAAVLIVDTTDGWAEGVDQIALRASAVIHTDAGIQVQSNDADLKASIAAAVAANAGAAAAMPTP